MLRLVVNLIVWSLVLAGAVAHRGWTTAGGPDLDKATETAGQVRF